MVLVSYFAINRIVRQQFNRGMDEMLLTAEANARMVFAEAEGTIVYASHSIQEMLDNGASQEQLLAYLTQKSAWMTPSKKVGTRLLDGMYAYVRGEFLDSIGMNPPPDYMPQASPWFDAALRAAPDKTAYTAPHTIPGSGKVTMSAVRNIYGKAGTYYGILVIDLDVSWFQEYAHSIIRRMMDNSDDLAASSPESHNAIPMDDGSYGMVLNQHMVVVGHPNDEFVNRQLHDISREYRVIRDELIRHREISAMHITDYDDREMVISFRQMFNGWYIGVAVPEDSYYLPARHTAFALSAISLVLMSILCSILLELAAARMRSEEQNRSKSNFLAQMSHEIRTPMNAVVGLSELGLRLDSLPALALEYFVGIQHAGQNLLAIINDILDFSKIESGNLAIANSPYMLTSLLDDVINITQVRLSGSPILFTVNVESAIPHELIGDETRLRQVLINVLSNAAKYTLKGVISFEIAGVRSGDGSLILRFKIMDSGIGIKPENMSALWEDFTRFDDMHLKGVEGTGLGLAIARRLCLAMGGSIMASSTYGEGSVFTVTIPQGFTNDVPLAEVENAQEKSVLCCGLDPFYAASVCRTLDDLGVEAVRTTDMCAFFEKLSEGNYAFAFISSKIVDQTMDFIKNMHLRTIPVLMTGLDGTFSFHDIPAILMPAYAVPIANILNHKTSGYSSHEPYVGFAAPAARVLLVDDALSNMAVAKGLLAPYAMQIDTCVSGAASLELIRENTYDLVLMDHMMPGMDGLEATARIRKMEKGRELPVVALTANAVSGMRELFLEKGMDDFLAKPIDVARLDAILRKWIPAEKQQPLVKGNAPGMIAEMHALFEIDGLDAKAGMFLCGGTETKYRGVLEQYCRDVAARIDFLTFSRAESSPKNFVIHTHALKSSSASIGAAPLSLEAAYLMNAAERGNLEAIRERVDSFREHLTLLVERIKAELGEKNDITAAGRDSPESPSEESISLLLRLKKALETEDVGTADWVLIALAAMRLDQATGEMLSRIADLVLVSDFAEAVHVFDRQFPEGKGLLGVQ